MTPTEIISILQACQASGVSSIKLEGLEVQFGSAIPQMGSSSPVHTPDEVSIPVEISAEEEAEIKHKVEELTSVMKLSDEELIDRLFPEPRDETEGVA